MAEVQIIEAKKEKKDRHGSVIKKQRVGAYCRVSTDSDEQMNSYDAQVIHYKNMIETNSDWVLVDIYADAGISGTKMDKRDEFNRMISDAELGKLDLVITKSISRFARNTVDTLEVVRKLKNLGVAVSFEKENINTLTMNGEMLLTILSSLAQQESESLSQNTKMGLKMKMQRGELVGYQGCLGYDYDKETKEIVINDEEAKIVRYIFDRYTSGIGGYVLAKELTEMGVKTKRGSTVWYDTTILGILKNEKYKGDVMMQKTFTVDPISKRRLDNFGEEQKYYIKDHHTPIISKEQFEEVHKILEKRSKHCNKGRMNKFSQQYTFSSMIECGFCGSGVSRKSWNSGTVHKKNIWQCGTKIKKGKQYCPPSKGLPEEIIEKAFVDAYNLLIENDGELIEIFLSNLEESLKSKDNKKQFNSLKKEVNAIEKKISRVLDLHLDGKIDTMDYEQKYTQLKINLQAKKDELFQLEINGMTQNDMEKNISDLRKYFGKNAKLKEFDAEVFRNVVEKIILGGKDEDGNDEPYLLTFVFKTGNNTKITAKNPKGRKPKTEAKNICSHQKEQAHRNNSPNN
ncbi:MAG: recombinase family protein [Clostridia bacterium]